MATGKRTSLTTLLLVLVPIVYCMLPKNRTAGDRRFDRLAVEKSKRLLHAYS